MTKIRKKVFLSAIIAAMVITSLWLTDFGRNITLEKIQNAAAILKNHVQAHYISSVIIYICIYITVNLSLPVAAILAVMAGYLFGTIYGSVYSDIATTLNAVLAFMVARSFIGERVQKKWHRQLQTFNDHLANNDHLYLILVRLVPIMPFFVLNLIAGLTKIRMRTFVWTTALGSLPGIIIQCYAGRQLLSLNSVNDIFTPKVIITIALLVTMVALITTFKIIKPSAINNYEAADNP
ncbi:MAG: VTT domain-containing protein [Phycisphaerae bacterium]